MDTAVRIAAGGAGLTAAPALSDHFGPVIMPEGDEQLDGARRDVPHRLRTAPAPLRPHPGSPYEALTAASERTAGVFLLASEEAVR